MAYCDCECDYSYWSDGYIVWQTDHNPDSSGLQCNDGPSCDSCENGSFSGCDEYCGAGPEFGWHEMGCPGGHENPSTMENIPTGQCSPNSPVGGCYTGNWKCLGKQRKKRKPIQSGLSRQKGGRVNSSRFSGRTQNNPKGRPRNSY